MLIQGSNNPLTIKLDTSAEALSALSVTLWDTANVQRAALKAWTLDDVVVDGDTIICPITEAETRRMPTAGVILEVKGLDNDGNTLFWAAVKVDVMQRRDSFIELTRVGG